MIIYQQKSPELAYTAFCELYNRYSQRVYSFILKKIKNQADADDLLQKVFIKIHESKHLYKDKFKFEQWLFVIARTSIIDHFRSLSRYRNRMDQFGKESNPDLDFSNQANINPHSAILNLDEDQRELLEMKFIDELSYQEISSILNKSNSSLRKMVSRMMINLKKENA